MAAALIIHQTWVVHCRRTHGHRLDSATGLLCNFFSKHRGETIASRYRHTTDRHRWRSRAPDISEVLPHGYFSKTQYMSSEEHQEKFKVSEKSGFKLSIISYPGQTTIYLMLTSVIYYCASVRPLTWPWQASWFTTDLFHAVGGTCECPWGSPGFLSGSVDPNLSVYWRSGCSLTASLSSTVYPRVQSGQRGGVTGCQSEPVNTIHNLVRSPGSHNPRRIEEMAGMCEYFNPLLEYFQGTFIKNSCLPVDLIHQSCRIQ